MVWLIIGWTLMAFLQIITYASSIAGLALWRDRVLVSAIFLIGAPFFTITLILEYIITLFLGDEWEDNGDGPKGI